MPCHGDSKSRCAKDKLGGILLSQMSASKSSNGAFCAYCCGCIIAKSIPTTSASLYLLRAQCQHFVVSYGTSQRNLGGVGLLTRPYRSPIFLSQFLNPRSAALDRNSA